MNTFARRDQILTNLQKESKGSFAVVYRAMSELSAERGSATLDEDEVRERIRAILQDRQAAG